MTTAIFKSYSDFLARDDKSVNGVSTVFSELHPDYEKQNETNRGCWNCSHCSDCSNCSNCWDCARCSHCSHCSDCSGCSHCSHCSDCSGCSYCSDCSDCSNCSNCWDCARCSHCSHCSGCSDKVGESLEIPKVEDLDAAVYAAASRPESLSMSTWHTCAETHCRAGWIITLAGEKGRKLESHYNSELAAMLIYEASTGRKINPSRFYDTNDEALADMKRLAECAGRVGDDDQEPKQHDCYGRTVSFYDRVDYDRPFRGHSGVDEKLADGGCTGENSND